LDTILSSFTHLCKYSFEYVGFIYRPLPFLIATHTPFNYIFGLGILYGLPLHIGFVVVSASADLRLVLALAAVDCARPATKRMMVNSFQPWHTSTPSQASAIGYLAQTNFRVESPVVPGGISIHEPTWLAL
jgi:hypothetical protein